MVKLSNNYFAIFMALFLGLFIASPIQSAEAETISIDDAYPPYMYSKNKMPKGFYSDIINAVFERMGDAVQINAMPWKRAVFQIDIAAAGLGGLYKTDKRLAKYDYSDAIYEETLVVYTQKNKSFLYTNLDDLNDRLIGVNTGWSYGNAFDKARALHKFKVQEVKTNLQNLKMLAVGRLDAVVIDSLSADLIVKKDQMGSQLVKLETPVTINGAFLAFHKSADKKDLLKRFNKALHTMKSDGSYDQIVKAFVASAK